MMRDGHVESGENGRVEIAAGARWLSDESGKDGHGGPAEGYQGGPGPEGGVLDGPDAVGGAQERRGDVVGHVAPRDASLP